MQLKDIYQGPLASTPHKTAYVCGDSPVSYLELDDHSRLYAQALRFMGLTAGGRVALCMHNIPQLPQLLFAVSRLGAVAVMISPYSTAAEMLYALVHSGACLLLTSLELETAAREAAAGGPGVLNVNIVDRPSARGPLDIPLASLSQVRAMEVDVEAEPLDPQMILYTSGSTALPKGIIHTAGSLQAAASLRSETLAMDSRDIYFNSGYLCHGAASTTALLPALYSGGCAVFPAKFSPARFWECMSRFPITIAAFGPSQLWEVLEHPLRVMADCQSLRYVSSGGDVVGEPLHRLFLETMGFPLSESMGMTECGTYITTRPGIVHKPGSMGKAAAGAMVRLVDDMGLEVEAGQIGQITVKTASMMAGYLSDEAASADVLVEGWLRTGDTAWQDQDGYYYFAGRIKNMIVRDMCNISPLELEGCIKQHPRVRDCGVVGIPDERHGQKVIAFVVLKGNPDEPGVSGPELEAFTARLIMGPRLPDQWLLVPELPATPMGKLDRPKLRQMALEQQAWNLYEEQLHPVEMAARAHQEPARRL